MKKICFIIPEYQFSTPTHFNYLYELIENLQQEVDIFLIIERGDKPDFFPPKADPCLPASTAPPAEKGGKIYVQKFRFLPFRFIENLLILFWARISGYKDFYIHYSFLSAFNASLIVKALGGRTFYWNCGLPWLYKHNSIRETFELLTYKLITYLVTGTEGLKNQYATHYRLPLAKIKVLPNWINVEQVTSDKRQGIRDELRKSLKISDGTKVLLFVHRLSRRKGAHYLAEIVKLLKAEQFVLLIAGDGPERKNIEFGIRNYELGDKARFLGWVPQNEILKYFAVADIFIMPSEEEGFPHVLLEAMAARVPFVAFNVGGVGEIVPPEFSYYLVASGNLSDFVKKIKELLNADSKNLGVLKQSELNWVRQFDIKFAIERFKNLF